MDLDSFFSAVAWLFAWALRNTVAATVLILLVALVQGLGRRTLPPF